MSRNVLSLGIFVGIARNSSHHLRYSPWISSFEMGRGLGGKGGFSWFEVA